MSTTSGESDLSLYRTIVARMTEGVALLRVSDASIVWTNPRLEAIFGGNGAKLRGGPSSSLLVSDGADLEPIRSALSRHGTWDGMVAPARSDGSTLSCRAQISTFEHDDHGSVWLAIFSDIAESPAPGEASTTRGMVLPGRGTLQEDLRRELARARRSQSPVAVAMLGLDGEIDFRDSNTIDELAKATEAWRGTLRDSDTIAHYEFSQFDYAVLMPDCAPDQAQMVTERARRATPDGLACSAGFACWDGDEGGVELTARAYKALKMARSRGGGLTMPALT